MVSIPRKRGWPEGTLGFAHMLFLIFLLMPKPTHPWHQSHKDEWEDATMPKPAHEWHFDHCDEQEDGFQDEVATILAKVGSKPRVMENRIKSPSLRRGYDGLRSCS